MYNKDNNEDNKDSNNKGNNNSPQLCFTSCDMVCQNIISLLKSQKCYRTTILFK